MKGFAMLGINKVGWIEKDKPACGPLDALVRPIAISPCTSDVHTVWEGALGERTDMILGHEAVGEVAEVGSLVKDFKPGDKVIVPAITPDWNSLEAQKGFSMHSGGMLAGWKFSNFKDGVFGEYFHVNDADGNLAHLPKELDAAEAVMLCDMVPTGFHGAELADVQYGDDVVVVGIGPVGLMGVAGAALRGAGRIYAVGSRQVCADAARGYGATRFSFNTPEGRCPACEGQGEITVEMSFLPDVKVLCDVCRGMRFDDETLSVKWQGKSIGEVLNLSVDDALEVFSSSPRIAKPLALLQAVGLGYLKLGQPSSTLSGGEAQRIKLVTELAKADSPAKTRRSANTFYILDEPTVGLHMADVEKLIGVLHRLVDAGNTVLVVEHNLDVMAEADWLIDLGPEGGPNGGRIMFEGEPISASNLDTPTGKALKSFLGTRPEAGGSLSL